MKLGFQARRLHLWIAGISFIFLTVTAVTGLLWAYAPYMYWQPGYMEKATAVSGLDINSASELKPVHEILQMVKDQMGPVLVTSLTLLPEANQVIYRIEAQDQSGKKITGLIDPLQGKWLSPLSEEHAVSFARQYVPSETPLARADFLQEWTQRKAEVAVEAWRVRFADSGETEIFLDPNTGEILEDQDRVRRFHWWVMRLHQFNFFGFHKVLSAVSGVPLLFLLGTGLLMMGPLLRRNRTRKKK